MQQHPLFNSLHRLVLLFFCLSLPFISQAQVVHIISIYEPQNKLVNIDLDVTQPCVIVVSSETTTETFWQFHGDDAAVVEFYVFAPDVSLITVTSPPADEIDWTLDNDIYFCYSDVDEGGDDGRANFLEFVEDTTQFTIQSYQGDCERGSEDYFTITDEFNVQSDCGSCGGGGDDEVNPAAYIVPIVVVVLAIVIFAYYKCRKPKQNSKQPETVKQPPSNPPHSNPNPNPYHPSPNNSPQLNPYVDPNPAPHNPYPVGTNLPQYDAPPSYDSDAPWICNFCQHSNPHASNSCYNCPHVRNSVVQHQVQMQQPLHLQQHVDPTRPSAPSAPSAPPAY